MSAEHAIAVDSLSKNYRDVSAVDGVTFEVRRGEIFGMVGPNGAGKTTTSECLEGIRAPTSGRVSVLGLDPGRRGRELREKIGVQLQQSFLPGRLKVREIMDLFSSFYRKTVPWPPVLDELGLAEKAGASFASLSGGQKQRLFIALALLNDPEIVFLDELTTGLDPQARRVIWNLVRGVSDKGKTVFPSAFAFFSPGYLVAGAAPTARAAQATGMILAFPMMFLSGSAIPLEVFPPSVRSVADFIPLTHVVTLMRGLWAGDAWGRHLLELAVLGGVLIAGMFLSARFFRWE
jgi:ABC-type Na+ transport system ATPase subunit NatA